MIPFGDSASQVALEQAHSCVLLRSGAVRCWGAGASGALGYGDREMLGDNENVADIRDVQIGGKATQVAVGFDKTCALMDWGGVRCWGDPPLGYDTNQRVGDRLLPAGAGDISLGGKAVQIAAGGFTACAVLADSSLRCWGGHGALGTGDWRDVGDDESPERAGMVDVGGSVVQVTAGTSHTCALLSAGRVRCWGTAGSGQLGYGNVNDIGDDEKPASAGDVEIGGEAVQVVAGGFHTCALLTSGCVRCWGLNDHGQLGHAHTRNIGDDELPSTAECVPIF